MFGISFSELLLVGLVALLVLGPERLPGAARTAGLWVGRLKRSFNAIKQEVEREIGADEIRRQLHNEHILSLEQEARKIFNPSQQEPTPVEPVGEQTIHSAAAPTPAPVVTPPGTAPITTDTSVEHVAPSAAPTTPAPQDPTLPPRAP
ncbi:MULTISPECIES: Sec-independent protein translocase protein TatB [Pseudomonas]|uniref:Sec-independent protein translocase protein TatB n=1 Tax=Pseudomonas TaxID=286 RepID=UPI000F46D155|nr:MULTISPECIES: Sec-independent protein translocase protein TatB [Pseudomonas]RON68428.1 Sec-independent protein translocase TatB [Pseudomonas fluorescens]MBH3445357.1 Sec-independent protein translocase subunit TatB [Pseudomonas moraviensis]MDT6920472.1 Sec-independent protein translocase protein TatB [Pseudomonas atacamensis]MEB2856161.1 Sec-independent protein translocase protein TatB [Pseudomonas atacamensis]QSL87489.1 Sec-independent protein translocase subunit TatB [Pseudomonas atacamen